MSGRERWAGEDAVTRYMSMFSAGQAGQHSVAQIRSSLPRLNSFFFVFMGTGKCTPTDAHNIIQHRI